METILDRPVELINYGCYVNENTFVDNQNKKEKPKYLYSIKASTKSADIITKMKNMVDRNALKVLIQVGNRSFVEENAVDMYLDMWANAKYDLFCFMGEKTRIAESVESRVDSSKVREKIIDLYNNFPVYAPVIKLFSVDDFLSNTCPGNEFLETYCDIYKPGQKLTRFFHAYFKDNDFDIEVSKILQNTKTSESLMFSIDPVDILTCSINKNGWTTCSGISTGCYACAPFSLMCDESTVIVFCSDNNMYVYSYREYGSFKTYSKSYRSFVNINKDNCSFVVTRCYPSCSNEKVYKAIKDACQKIITSLFGINNDWYTTIVTQRMDSSSCGGKYFTVSKEHMRVNTTRSLNYVKPGGHFVFVDPIKYVCTLENKPIEQFIYGVKELVCPVCGAVIEKFVDNTILSCGCH